MFTTRITAIHQASAVYQTPYGNYLLNRHENYDVDTTLPVLKMREKMLRDPAQLRMCRTGDSSSGPRASKPTGLLHSTKDSNGIQGFTICICSLVVTSRFKEF